MKKLLLCTLFCFFGVSVYADFVDDPNNGFFSIDFLNTTSGLGPIGAPYVENISHDAGGGTVAYGSVDPSYFTTAEIQPASFRNWDKITLDASINNAADLTVDVTRCDGVFGGSAPTVISGYAGLTPVGGVIDISGIPVTEGCIQVRVNLSDSDGIYPSVSNLEASWDPLPVFLVRLDGDLQKVVGDTITYFVDYSVSYVDSDNVFVWVPLPENATDFSNYTAGYNQSVDPGFDLSFVEATGGGMYTSSPISIDGVAIPANSVYWDLGYLKRGFAGTLGFKLRSKNGLEDELTYTIQAHMDSLAADEALSDDNPVTPTDEPFTTVLTSEPLPRIDKTVSGIITLPGKNIVYDGGNFSANITYSIAYSNGGGSGRETMFNPIVTDDLSDIYAKMMAAAPAGCGVASKAAVTALINPGSGVLDETSETITWDFSGNHLKPGGSGSVSFTVDYSPCLGNIADGSVITNTSNLDSDKTTVVADGVPITFGIDATPQGIFRKGDRVRGNKQVTAARDDNVDALQTYEETATYIVEIANTGLVRLDDSVFFDKVPASTEFVSALLPAGFNGTIYYTTDGSYTDPASPPPFSYTGARDSNDPGAIWSDTVPVNPENVTWVAFYIPCISSAVFDSPVGSECEDVSSLASVEMTVRILSPGDPGFLGTDGTCSIFDTTNNGLFYAYEASNSVSNADVDVVALGSPFTVNDLEPTHIAPLLGKLNNSSTGLSGTSIMDAGNNASYSLKVANTGDDALTNVSVTINLPEVTVNGGLEYLELVSVTAGGGSVDYSGLPSQVVITYPEIVPAEIRTINFELFVPKGFFNRSEFTVSANITADDPEGCKSFSKSVNTSTVVLSSNFLEVRKSRNEALIKPYSGGPVSSSSEDVIHYQLTYENLGSSPSTQTFVVDRIPDKTIFVEAYTSPAQDSLLNTFNCVDCKVYFAKQIPDLPPDLTAADPITSDDVLAYFVEGVEVSPGIWLPPTSYASPEEVYYIAWEVDDAAFSPPQFPVGAEGRVGFLARNDNNGILSGNEPSPDGTLIRNSAAVLSAELQQAIGNQVVTTILANPGLVIDKSVSEPVVKVGQNFFWTINYRNNGSSSDVEASLNDILPAGIELVSVEHSWNNLANANGAPVGSTGDITSNPAVTLTANLDGTTGIFVKISSATGSNLRGEALRIQEGGSLIVHTRVASGTESGTTFINEVEGCYDDGMGTGFCAKDTEPVDVEKPDLWLRKFVNEERPAAGEIVTYTLLLSNVGPVSAENVVITDTLPAGLCYQTGSTDVLGTDWVLGEPTISGGPCASAPTTLTWTGILNPGHEDYPAYPPAGTLVGNSSTITINYEAEVDASVAPGTLLPNVAVSTTSDEEDDEKPNDDDKEVKTPLPDPYVVKTGDTTVYPGGAFNYQLIYGNASKMPVSGVYVIDTMPVSGGTPTISLNGINVGNSEAVYCSTAASAPTVNPSLLAADLITAGWSLTCPVNTTYFLVVVGSLGAYDGPYNISVSVSAVDPDTGGNLSAGVTFTNAAHIYPDGPTEDDDPTNNDDTHDTKTPNANIYVKKTGSIEGAFPGTLPGEYLTYTIEFGNSGTEPMCAVFIEDTLPVELIALDPVHNFNVLELFDAENNPVRAVDLTEMEITSSVNINYSLTGSVHRWDIGDDPDNTCIPAGSHGSFEIYTQIRSDLTDSTSIVNPVHIGEDSPAIEEPIELLDNDDESQVTVYRADVSVTKEGYGCGADDDCNTLAPIDYSKVSAGDDIEYIINYNNSGNTEAENTVIKETIPEGTCYKVGTVESAQPSGTTLEYSNDNGFTWSYVPVADGNGNDCNVTHFRVKFNSSLPAPATYWSQGSAAEFSTNSFTGDAGVLGEAVSLIGSSGGVRNLSDEADSAGIPTFDSYGGGLGTIFDSSGTNLHVAWVDNYNKLIYHDGSAYTDLSAGAISAGVITGGGSAYLAYPDRDQYIDIDSTDNIHIIWGENNSAGFASDLLYYNSTNYTNLTDGAEAAGVLSDAGYVGGDKIIHLDSADNPRVVWIELNSIGGTNLDVLYYDGSSYINLSSGAEGAGVFTDNGDAVLSSFKIDDSDNIHILWTENNSASSSTDLLYYNGSTYTNLTDGAEAAGALVDNGQAYTGYDMEALLIDSSGNPHIIWSEYNSAGVQSDLIYYNGSTYVNLTNMAESAGVLVDGGLSAPIAFVLDNSDNPHIVWNEYNSAGTQNDMFYYDGSSIINLTDGAEAAGVFVDSGDTSYVARTKLDTSNRLHIVWSETNADLSHDLLYYNGVTYANLSDGAEAAGVMIDNGYVDLGYGGFLGLDSSNNAHISWIEDNSAGNGNDMFYYNGTSNSYTNLTDGAEAAGLLVDNGYIYYSQAILDGSGNFYATWAEPNAGSPGNSEDMFFYDTGSNTYKNLTQEAETAGVFTDGGYVVSWEDIDLLVDTAGNPHLLWTEISSDTHADLLYFKGGVGLSFTSGTVTTPLITPDCGSGTALGYGKLLYNAELAGESTITFDILDSTDNVIGSFGGLFSADAYHDLSSIDIATYPGLKLRANLAPDVGNNVPTLNTWVLTYTCDTLPSFTFKVRVLDSDLLTTTTIDNAVVISTTTPETDYTNNNDNDRLIVRSAELNLDKTVDKAAALNGETLTYTINYCNEGPELALNAVITDKLPTLSGTQLVSYQSGSVGCSEAAGVVTCNLGNLDPGACGSVNITANINASSPPAANTVLTNNACIASDTHDSDGSDDCDTAKTTVATIANVYTLKEAPDFAYLGQELTYTITYGNNGNAIANGVIIKDTFADASQLDSSFTAVFNYISGDVNNCAESGGVVTCDPVDLSPGETGEFTVTVKASVSNTDMLVNAETIDNTACAEYSGIQADISDDCDNEEVPVVKKGLADLGGTVFRDRDEDVEFDGDDNVIPGVTVYMYGYDIYGNVFGPDPSDSMFNVLMGEIIADLQANVDPAITLANLADYDQYQITAPDVTDIDGTFAFSGLNIGTYNLAEIQPDGYYSTGANGGQYISPLVAGYDNTATTGSSNPGHGVGDTGAEGGSNVNYIRGIYLTEGEASLFNDFGENLGSIGDLIFSDPDQDGVHEPADGEIGIPSVEVSLYIDVNKNGVLDAGDTLEATQFTDVNGNYLFDGLSVDDGSGSIDYLVVVTDGTGVLNGALNVLGPDQSANPASNNNSKDETGFAVTLDSTNTSVLVADFGYYPLSALGDYVWYDANGNGVQDSDEVGVTGITVNLYSTADLVTPVNTTVTNGSGYYEFIDLAPGDYVVEFVPGALSFTTQNTVLAGDVFDSDADTTTGRTATVSLLPGEFDKTVDAGLISTVELAALGDKLWYDINNNGIQDSGETGIGGVIVKLFDGGNNLISATTTDSSGYYEFTGLIPGDYKVEFVKPTGYEFSPADQGADDALDSDSDITTGQTQIVTLAEGEFNTSLDAGLYSATGVAGLGDYVWLDINANGMQDGGESGVPGITVELYDSADNLISSTITDTTGYYDFQNLIPGDYYVKFIKPVSSTYSFTIANIGADDTIDSDADIVDGKTPTVTLIAGDFNDTLDAGLVLPAAPSSIGDYVWEDSNGDGLQDESGTGIANVTVELLDSTGGVIATTTTDSSGNYLFPNLSAGDYYVRFTTPDAYAATFAGTGHGAANDSDADPYSGSSFLINLPAATNDLTIDAGYVRPASLGDRVWEDSNEDGIQDVGESGISGVTVILYDGNGNQVGSTTTDSNGNYLFDDLSPGDYYIEIVPPTGYVATQANQGGDDTKDSDLDPVSNKTSTVTLAAGENNVTLDAGFYPAPLPPASLGDFVWEDTDKDGIQDVGEPVVPGVIVNLYDSANNLVASKTTDANGHYLFDNLTPGDYTVEFILPDGYASFSPQDQGSDSQDSDAGTNGRTPVITLDPGENDLTVDAGLIPEEVIPPDPVLPNPGCQGVTDFDGDGIPDLLDDDIDGDGILNTVETEDDADGDGYPNSRDVDSDGDGLADYYEARDAVGNVTVPDTDSDTIPDYLDTDSDNDGILDMFEIQDPNHFIPPAGSDSDCDGLDDTCEDPTQCNEYDDDPNGKPDYRETPLDCKDDNLLPMQFGMDGEGAELMDAVGQSLVQRSKLARSGSCEALSRKQQKNIRKLASDYYLDIWRNSWSIPSESYPCQSTDPKSGCLSIDPQDQLEGNKTAARKLFKLVKKSLKTCTLNSKSKKLKKKARKLKNAVIEHAENIPQPITNCN